MFTWPMSFMHPSWWSPPWCYSGPPSCFEWRRNRIEEYVDQRRSKWIKLVYFPFYEQSHFLRVICQHGSLPAVIERRQRSKIMDKTSWIKSVWQCEAVLYYCLLIVYVKPTSLVYRWFTFTPLSLLPRLNRARINTFCSCTGGLRMQLSTGCRAFSIGSLLFHLPTKHVARQVSSRGFRRFATFTL